MGRRPKEPVVKRKIKRPKLKKFVSGPAGMPDVLSSEIFFRRKVIKVVQEVADYYGFNRIELPVIEKTEIFSYGIGQGTDIVKEKIIDFKTPEGQLALRPDFTPAMMRSYIENKMSAWGKPVKLFTCGPLFRREKPESEKDNQFWQCNFEVIGDNDPIYDALSIQVLRNALFDLKINNLSVEVNTVGCDGCRMSWLTKFKEDLSSKKQKMCKDCKKKYKVNPLWVLECQNEECQEITQDAPKMIDYLCASCRRHFMALLEYLESAEIPFNINNRLVKSLDYYTRTIFQIKEVDKDISLAEGGRYDYLADTLGSRSTSGVGGAINIDKLSEILESKDKKGLEQKKNKVFLVLLGDLAKKKGLSVLESLRKSGVSIAESFGRGSLNDQFKQAEKQGILLMIIIGQKEAVDGTAILRDIKSGAQETIVLENLTKELKKKLKSIKS